MGKEAILMRVLSSELRTLDDLFVYSLHRVYFAERQIETTLPVLIASASCRSLKTDLAQHLFQTKIHIQGVKKVFQMLGIDPREVVCPAFVGILKEADDLAGEFDDGTVRDAALTAAARAMKHYGIARYGSLIAWAKQLGRNDCAALLRQNLDDEKAVATALIEKHVALQLAI